MKKIILFCLIIVFNSYTQEGGNAGLAVLKSPLTAWQMALGEQLTVGREATWTNPALMAGNTSVTLLINHEKWISDVDANFIGIQIPTGNWVLSAQYFISQVEGLEVRTAATETPVSLTDAHFLYGKISAGYRWNENIFIGSSIKMISEKIYTSWNQGYALDFALTYFHKDIPLSISAMAANLGSTHKLRTESTIMPFLFAVGAKYQILEIPQRYNLDLTTEIRKSRSTNTKISIGAEFSLFNIVHFQSGYILNDEYKNFSAGMQVSWNNMRFGIGWLPMSNDFSDKKSFSFNIDF